jgi:ABC-type phosphate transport system substrate-binding protein
MPDIPLADDWNGTFVRNFSEPFERVHAGVLVQPISGGAGTVELAGPATDVERLTTELGGAVVELPAVWSPVTIAYNLDGVDDLRLAPRTLAGIFAGSISRWDDPAIARDNRGRALPSRPIVVLQETSLDDEVVVTRYLERTARAAWKLGETSDSPFFAGVTHLRAYEIGGKLADTAGAIGYVGPGVAETAKLQVARLQDARGAFVAPTPATIAARTYPLVAPRTVYVATKQPDAATADAVRVYATWLLSDGLAVFEQLGYVRQPAKVTEAALTGLRAVTGP